MTTQSISKKPVLAAIFNLLIPGVGYLYIGARKKFAWLLIAASVVSLIAIFDPQSIWYFANEKSPQLSILESISLLLVSAAFAYDAYTEAQVSHK